MKVSITHVVPVPVEKAVSAYGDMEFYAARQKDGGAISVDILETEDLRDGKFRFRARVTEPSRVPSFLRKSDVDTYVDDSVLDTTARTLTWKITPSVAADLFKMSGRVDFSAQENSTRVTYNVTMEVKIPLLGKKAEKHGLAKTEEACEQQSAFLKKWINEQSPP